MSLFKNKFFYAVILILGLIFFSNIKDVYQNYKNLDEKHDTIEKYCSELLMVGESLIEMDKKEDYQQCKKLKEYNVYTSDGYSVYVDIINTEGFDLFLFFVCPILIMTTFVFYVSKMFKNKIIKEYILREDYNKFLKGIFISSYKSVIIIPIFLLITFLCSWKIAGHLVYQPFTSDISLSSEFLGGMPVNGIIYLLCIMLVYSIVVSIALICLSKNKNPFLVIVETFIIFFALAFVNEAVVVPLLASLKLGIDINGLCFLAVFVPEGYLNIWHWLIELVIYNTILGIVLYYSYRNKEKLLQMCES